MGLGAVTWLGVEGRELPGREAGARGDLSQPGGGQGEGMDSPCTGRLWQPELFVFGWSCSWLTGMQSSP